jgi:hypothetical protein
MSEVIRSLWRIGVTASTELAVALLLAGCGSLYKVKPAAEAPIKGAAGARAGEIVVRAVPLLSDEESQELFEANLPLAGLLPVRLEISNSGGTAVELKRARFHLRDDQGREWKVRSAKQAVSRILDANDISLYNPQARANFEEAFRAHALDTLTPLAPAERRQGLIFFQTPKKEPLESPHNLVITIERLPQPIELPLD